MVSSGYAPLPTAFGNVYYNDGNGGAVNYPVALTHWRCAFCRWIVTRYYDCRCDIIIDFGPDSHSPELEPFIESALNRGKFDLLDVTTMMLWMEYLDEIPERGRLWRRFEQENGTQYAL